MRLANELATIVRHIFHYLILALVFGALAFFVIRRGQLVPKPLTDLALLYESTSTPEFLQRCGPVAPDRRSVSLSMVASPDKREWLEPVVERFGHLCPNIQVKLTVQGSFEAVDDIVKGRLRPTLWSPSSGTALRYLEYRWRQKGGSPFEKQEPTSLVRSPIIWMMADDRYRVLSKILGSKQSDEGQWMQAACAMVARSVKTTPDTGDITALDHMLPGLWADWYGTAFPAPRVGNMSARQLTAPDPLIEQLGGWGRVKLGHANPIISPLGFESLYLMSYDYLVPPRERSPAQTDPGRPSGGAAPAEFKRAFAQQKGQLRDWLHRCEAGQKEFRDTGTEIIAEFFNLGAARYDIVVAYEHVTLPILEQVRQHAAEMALLRIVYPEPTLWADHPVVLLKLDP